MDWADIQLFHWVAETGSFSGAARVLGLSQPTVSSRVRELESRLATQLFARSGNAMALTETGVALREYAKTMERTSVAIERLAADHDRTQEGRVRLSAPDGVAAFWLAPRLAQFQKANPKIAISIDAGLWPSDKLRDEIDVSIMYEENKNPDNVVVPLTTVHYAFFATAEYLDLYGTPETFAEMATHRSLQHAAQSRQKDGWEPGALALQTLWESKLETNSSSAVLFAARAGGGIAMMPTAVTTFAPEMVLVGPGRAAKLMLWMVYHRDVARVARVRRVIEWIRSVFDPANQPWFREEFVHPKDFGAYLQSSGGNRPEVE
jgi:DNA-binding transcriptional LysR family regulator